MVAQESRLDVSIDYFHMPHGEDQAGLVLLCNFAGKFDSTAQVKFRVAIKIKSDRGKTSLEGEIGIKEKWVFIQDFASISAL